MGEKIKKTFSLFGVEIETWVYENAPAPMSRQVLIPPIRGLELPQNAWFLGKKRLKASDVSRIQSRFLVPNCQKNFQALNDSEKDTILNKNKGFRVKVMDSKQVSYSMNFRRWPSLNKFVLNKGWFKLVEANQLKIGDVIELWCYRQGSELRFAVDICERNANIL